MDFNFKTLTDFTDFFKDEKTCYEFLETQRWKGVPICPHCGSEKYYKVKARGKFKDMMRSSSKQAIRAKSTLFNKEAACYEQAT